jgi:hypothetical protein
VDGTGKGLETFARIELIGFNWQLWVNHRGVLTKAEIDNLSFLSKGLLYVGSDEILIIFNAINLPDDIVTHPQTVKDFIKTIETSCHPSVVHGHPL